MKTKVLMIAFLGMAIYTGVGRSNAESPTPAQMREDNDGELLPGEYTVISANGGITRALCPYTCEMRQLPAQFCKTWQSLQDKSLCYVQDTRLPSDAIQFGASEEPVQGK